MTLSLSLSQTLSIVPLDLLTQWHVELTLCGVSRLLPDRAPNIVDLAAEIPVDTYAALADQ